MIKPDWLQPFGLLTHLSSKTLSEHTVVRRLLLINLLIGLVISVMISPLAAAAEPVVVDIRVVHEQNTYRSLDILMSFNGEADGDTALQLPHEWGGQKEFYKSLRDLKIEGAQIAPNVDPVPQTRFLQHAPNARITLSYKIVDDEHGPKFEPNQNNDYRTQLKPDFVFALGNGIIIQPSSVSTNHTAAVRLQGFKSEHAFASDLQHGAIGRSMTFADVVESVIIGGDIRLIDAGGGARLALRGSMTNRNDDDWKQSFLSIANAQRNYWRSNDEPFLVTVMLEAPKDPNSISVGGTGRGDAFAFFATTNADTKIIDQTMAHEMSHTWVPRRIGMIRTDPALEAQDYWLSEGFTDWVTWRIAVRSSQWTPTDFFDTFNEQIMAYDLSPVREAPNSKIIQDFWKDGATGRLPYQRGMLLATYWNHLVEKNTRGKKNFDDVLWQMLRDSKNKRQALAIDLLKLSLKKHGRIDNTSDMQAYVENGRAVEFADDLFAACGKLEWIKRKTFHRGFDIEATLAKSNIISGVMVNGPAWNAGLRDGMKLIRRSGGQIGVSTVEIAYDIEHNGKQQTLRWMPEGQGEERFRQFMLKSNMKPAEQQACVQTLAGGSSK
jgi:predicted metalloprotease with PDZ domain